MTSSSLFMSEGSRCNHKVTPPCSDAWTLSRGQFRIIVWFIRLVCHLSEIALWPTIQRVSQVLSRVWLHVTSWTVARQAPLSMDFPRQEYWSGLPFPFPGDLPKPGIEPFSSALAGRFFIIELPRKPTYIYTHYIDHESLSQVWAHHPHQHIHKFTYRTHTQTHMTCYYGKSIANITTFMVVTQNITQI